LNLTTKILQSLLNNKESIYTDEQIRAAAAWALGKPTLNLNELQPSVLQPILETINRPNHTSTYRFEPQKLTLGRGFFPAQKAVGTEGVNKQLSNLERAGINLTNLEIYGSSISCSPQFADVPLFDFVKMTAAIAYGKSKSGKLQLVCGSVSGIQGYLYDIISRQAAKNLKGRSFYIQMLCDAVLEQVRQTLQLPEYCTVYASGGGFYLLVPFDTNTEGLVAKLQDKINQTLLKEHGLTLSVELFVSEAFDETKNFNKIWNAVFEEGNKLKRRRFAEQLTEAGAYNLFFSEEHGELGGLQPRDGITNEEFGKNENPKQHRVFDLEVKKTTKQQVDLGRELKDAKYWMMSKSGNSHDRMYNWNIYNSLEKRKPIVTEGVIFSKRINEIIDDEPFTFYGGNEFPTKTDDDGKQSPKYFEELAQGDALDRLGILRMDVDNLGSLVQNGLGTKACFSRLCALSRSLDYFFKGYLNTLWKKTKDCEDHSYILYSGGDDLFIVGRWDTVLNFSLAIQKEFKEWTCHNPALSISGGMAIVPSKFPIVQAARIAEDAEKAAKNHSFTEGDITIKKNAFAFLNVPIYWHPTSKGEVPQSFFAPLNWQEEMPLVEALRSKLSELLNVKETITKSLLGKIATYADMQARQINIKQKGRWTWIMAYDLSRYRDTIKDADTKTFLNLIISNSFVNRHNDKPVSSNYTYLQMLALAARWVELEYRTTNQSS
jgi:CRISPR-associated protein Csm1